MNARERFEKVRNEQRNRFSLRTRLTVFVTVEMLVCVLVAYGLDQLLNNVLELEWTVLLEIELICSCLFVGILVRVHSVTKKALKSLHFPTKYAIITARE